VTDRFDKEAIKALEKYYADSSFENYQHLKNEIESLGDRTLSYYYEIDHLREQTLLDHMLTIENENKKLKKEMNDLKNG